VEARTRLRPKTDAVVEISRTAISHRQELLGRDVTSQRLLAGVNFDATALLQGEIRYGLLSFMPADPSRSGYRGPVGRAALHYRLLRRLRLGADYERDLEFSVFGENLFYRRERIGLSASTALSRRFQVEAGGSRSLLRYPVAVSFAGFSGRRQDAIQQTWVGWSYAPPGRPRYGVRVLRWERDSNFDVEDDTQYRIIGEATYAF
jgi:hypothetical protein